MTLRFSWALGFLSLAVLCLSCARGDEEDPGRVTDVTFIWDAESLTRSRGKVEAMNPVEPADTRTLAWTAAGDDGRHGEATLYDIRCISSSELGKRNWTPEQAFGRYFDQTTAFINEPKPSPAGTLERWFLPRLDVSETYFFALTVEDEVGRFSGLSNIAGPAQPSLLALPLLNADGSTESGLGSAVASAQDLNGDKLADLVAGSPLQGKAYVYFGAGTNDLLETVENIHQVKVRKVKKELRPAITLIGSTAEEFGIAVAGVGRVNRSAKAEVAVGASAGVGKVYLFDGDSLAEGEVQDTNANVVILGDMAGDNLGASVVALGDLNRDGFADFGATAPGAGKVYIFLGGDEGSARGPLPSGQTAGQVAGLTLVGETVGDGFGQVLVRGGDLNGDGIPDLVAAAPKAVNPQNGDTAGAVYVFYGGDAGGIKFKTDLQAAGTRKVWDLSAGQKADVTIRGTAIGERFGSAVTSAGDLRKRPMTETATDLAVGAPGEGRVFIFYAGTEAGREIFPASATGLVWQDTDRHEVLDGDTADGFGQSLVGPGDINLDGYDDLVAGLPGQEAVKIYFWTLEEPVTDFRTLLLSSTAGSGFGLGLASAGDLNQDGYADLIIGAPDAGLAYLEF